MTYKNLGLILDEKLLFTNCSNDKVNKALKDIGLLCKLTTLLPRQSLITIYKPFTKDPIWIMLMSSTINLLMNLFPTE